MLYYPVVFISCLHHLAAFPDVMGGRFFHIDVFISLASVYGAQGMPVIRCRDEHRIEIIRCCSAILRGRLFSGGKIRIENRNEAQTRMRIDFRAVDMRHAAAAEFRTTFDHDAGRFAFGMGVNDAHRLFPRQAAVPGQLFHQLRNCCHWLSSCAR